MNRELKPSKEEITKLLRAAQKGDLTCIEFILTKYTKFHWSEIFYEKTGDTVLHCAARLGHISIIHYLISRFTPTAIDCKNKDDKTPLHEAAQFSQFESCKILIEYGANVNALKRADWTPLMLACTKLNPQNSWQTVHLLLENKSIVNYKNKDGWTCAHLIAREGDETIFKLLIEYGLEVRAKTSNGRTALHIAALHGKLKIVEVLLDLDCDVNEKDNCGNTPLHEALLGNNIDIFRILISCGADICAKNHCDYGLFHLAACEGSLEVIQYILDVLKLDVNEVNKLGLTPLHCAARKGRKVIYEFLVQNGASEASIDNFGRQALDYLQ
nr:ankyrin repeat domain-containing protein 16-like [Leptinotarsa decemlineata]